MTVIGGNETVSAVTMEMGVELKCSQSIIIPQSACLYNYVGYITLPPNVPNSVENYYSELLINFNVHVKDVVTDWSYALAGLLVPTLFGVSPGQS